MLLLSAHELTEAQDWTLRVLCEFYGQGDEEKILGSSLGLLACLISNTASTARLIRKFVYSASWAGAWGQL